MFIASAPGVHKRKTFSVSFVTHNKTYFVHDIAISAMAFAFRLDIKVDERKEEAIIVWLYTQTSVLQNST